MPRFWADLPQDWGSLALAGVVLQPDREKEFQQLFLLHGILCICVPGSRGKARRSFHCHLGLSTLPKAGSDQAGIWYPDGKGREGVAGELPAAPPVPWDSSQIPTNNWRAVLTLCWGLFQVKLFYLKPPSPLLSCLKLSLLKYVRVGRDLLAFTAGVGHSLNIHFHSS